jgi:hypothetical protein
MVEVNLPPFTAASQTNWNSSARVWACMIASFVALRAANIRVRRSLGSSGKKPPSARPTLLRASVTFSDSRRSRSAFVSDANTRPLPTFCVIASPDPSDTTFGGRPKLPVTNLGKCALLWRDKITKMHLFIKTWREIAWRIEPARPRDPGRVGPGRGAERP